MPVIGGPPRLAIRHQCGEIGLERLIVELLECLGIVEFVAHRVVGAVRGKDVDRQRIGPPVAILTAEEAANAAVAAHRATTHLTGLCVHFLSPRIDAW